MITNDEKVTFTYLKELNEEIKSGDLTRRENAFAKIQTLDLKHNTGLEMYASYLKGKYFYLKSKEVEELDNLYKAHQNFKRVFTIARNKRKFVKNPKFHFKYAETSYRLSQIVLCLNTADDYDSLAFSVNANASMLFPGNSSIKWLMEKLTESSKISTSL
ncbi:hypothetical protein [Polaribacter cellanae]|uniref:Uncharacterized protein n=1 Tax=Polaribacter cellanae TaxID=2818493 RepID=A0A975CK20_9FLAO|nr:hypothetical protein [Polaribacter cellanae]QTE21113.1 hypothetical protein J3359_09645 [Polaribacter cellanae]